VSLRPALFLAVLTLAACHSVSGVSDDQDADGSPWDEDCDDLDPSAYPGAEEICDGVDNDCDGDVDEDAVDAPSWAVDADGDSYGDMALAVSSCEALEGMVEDASDCDDSDATIHPAADEIWYDGVDQDCDGASDYDADQDGHDSDQYDGEDCDDQDASVNPDAEEIWYDGVDGDCDGADDYDQDGDGVASGDYGGGDCDDTDPAVYPGAEEIWYDGVDQDCDGGSDYDQDGDGYDSDAYGGTDCADTDPRINPGATETWYDGVDGDCDGADDYDQDGDGYQHDGHGGDDCDDGDASVYPGASDSWYDGVDSDCDGADDYDQDGDGYQAEDHGGADCDDTDAAVNPDATETWYDGVDQDCDGALDYDQDGDSYASDDHGGTDCDDTDATVSPGASESCDGIDNDCDGTVDEDDASDALTWYADDDGDGWGDASNTTTACDQPTGTVTNASDCDDSDDTLNRDDADGDGYDTCEDDCDDADATVNPGAEDVEGNGVDDDCDGEVDNSDETWVVTTPEDFMLGSIDGNTHFTVDDDGELQLAWLATGFTATSATESLPSARSSMGVVAANGYLYTVGGSVGSSSYSTDVASAAINTDGSLDPWDDSLEEIPTGTTTVALATDGHCLVMAGGYTSSDSTAEEVYTAELYGDGTIAPWVAQQDLPSGRGYAQAVVVRGYVYVLGGYSSSGASSRVYYGKLEPDCSIDSWSTTTSLPASRYSHAAAAVGDHIYVVGGRSSSSASSRVYKATPGTTGAISSWSTENSMPDSLYQLGATVVDGYLIAGGGYDGYYNHDELYYASIEADGSLGSWGVGTATLSGDRRYVAFSSWDGIMYQVGGRSDRSSSSATRSDTVQLFVLTESASATAHQLAFSYVFDLGANSAVSELDWDVTSVSDGAATVYYRMRTDAGSAGSWNSAGSAPPLSLSATARFVEVWIELSSSTGDASTIDEISLTYEP